MFFYIGKHCNLLTQVNDNLHLDKGWSKKDNIYYKGYSCECSIGESIDDIVNGYKPNGIWIVINNKTVYHSTLRGFPLYQKDKDFTNIPNLKNFDLVYDKINWSSNYDELSLDEVTQKVFNILIENINGFIKFNNEKLKVLLTGGLDSTVVWALVQNLADIEIVKTPHKTRTYNSDLIIIGPTVL